MLSRATQQNPALKEQNSKMFPKNTEILCGETEKARYKRPKAEGYFHATHGLISDWKQFYTNLFLHGL